MKLVALNSFLDNPLRFSHQLALNPLGLGKSMVVNNGLYCHACNLTGILDYSLSTIYLLY